MILVRYSEIALKSRFVRRKFENILMENIKRVLKVEGFGDFKLKKDWGRIYVYSDDENVAKRISKIFGVASTSLVVEANSDINEIKSKVVKIAAEKIGKEKSFAIRVRRFGRHDYTSMDVAKEVGYEVKKITNAKVDLNNPDVEIGIEIRDDKAYIFTEIFKGYAGLPVGTQERVLCYVCNDNKSFLTAWFALKRGCDVDLIGSNLDNLREFKKLLESWACYRKIDVFEGDLEEAFRLKHNGIFLPITAKELKKYMKILKERTKPVFVPLLPFDEDEILKKIEDVKLK